MHYVIEYEACALVFLIVIAVRYFDIRHFPCLENRLFSVILWCAMADLSLDIIGSITAEHAASVPVWVNLWVNSVFYGLQVVFPVLLLCYLFALSGHRPGRGQALCLALPFAAYLALLVTNPFTRCIFYIDGPTGLYTKGPCFNGLYFATLFYMGCTLYFLLKKRASLPAKKFTTIWRFLLIVLAAMGIQFAFPHLLLTGVAIAVAITMMFLTMQNPEDMLDLVTGTFNYGALMQFLRLLFRSGRAFQLIAADVGGLRRINSMFGAEAGNRVLGKVGAFFQSGKEEKWVFRMIGTRFLIITARQEDYRAALGRMSERFDRPWQVEGVDFLLTCSIRCAPSTQGFPSPESVVNLIDRAYAEPAGVLAPGVALEIDRTLLEEMHRQMEVEDAVREAVRRAEGFELYFQPLYSPRRGSFVSAEALVRFHHPALGDVGPAEFIPLAEKAGLIFQIDEIVLRKCCRLLRSWQPITGMGLESVEINLSAAEFARSDLAERLIAIVREEGADPANIRFEITETAASGAPGALMRQMERLKEAGFRFALDDFGVGYANLSQVLRLPFSMVKLDRSLFLSGEKDQVGAVLFEDLTQLFGRLGCVTVAEGVETGKQAERARRAGADLIQGYYYAKPMPEAEFIRFMRRQPTLFSGKA